MGKWKAVFLVLIIVLLVGALVFQGQLKELLPESLLQSVDSSIREKTGEARDRVEAVLFTPVPCAHEQWENGICTACGESCAHLMHGPDGLCTVCSLHLPHDYLGGSCMLCGAALPTITEGFIDAELFTPCPEKGTVKRVSYESHDYTKVWTHYIVDEAVGDYSYPSITKHMTVYLPYGYDENLQYNVLLLLPGSTGTENSYLMDAMDYDGSRVYLANLLDELIYAGAIDPLIVITINYFTADTRTENDPELDRVQLRFELDRDILPYIASNFATYTDTREGRNLREAIRDARDHFGFYGSYYGCVLGYDVAVGWLMDSFSWFGLSSGYTPNPDRVVQGLTKGGYRVNFLYANVGELDSGNVGPAGIAYQVALSAGDAVRDGENGLYEVLEGAGHEDRVRINALYECLLRFFR